VINLKHRRALSEVISTTILVAAMLIIVIGVMGFAFDLFNTQTQEAEFSQAQTSMVSLAQSVDTIIPAPGAAAYVTFNSRTGGPDFLKNSDNISISILSNNTVSCGSGFVSIQKGCAFSTNMSQFVYRAGSQVSYSGAQWIRAGNFTGHDFLQYFNNTLIVMNNTSPLGFVYLVHTNGSTWVVLDYRRIDVNLLGIFNVSEGVALNPSSPQDPAGNPNFVGQFQAVNIVQIYLVRLLYGNSSGGGNIVTSVQNMNISRYTVTVLPSSKPAINNLYNISIIASLKKQVLLPGQSQMLPYDRIIIPVQATYYGLPVTTIINMYVINIRLTMTGG